MPYTLEYMKSAVKELSKLPADTQNDIVDAAEELTINPRPDGVTKIQGAERTYRIKVGRDYRVLYEIDDKAKMVTVTKVGPRGNFYDR